MNIVLFAHPNFLNHQSMPRYVKFLCDGMRKRGHHVEVWFPEPKFFHFPFPKKFKKWLGYIDQYISFPISVRQRIKKCPTRTLFVFTDQALGPWVSLIGDRPHAIHCHDFMALKSSMNEIPENPTGWTGRQYQQWIHRGFSKGKHFISVSAKTREDLHRFLPSQPFTSEVMYNGLNKVFRPGDAFSARIIIGKKIDLDLENGYLLHVGGNQFYKNRRGVIELYDAWRETSALTVPLMLIGEAPGQQLLSVYNRAKHKSDIYFVSDINDDELRFAYVGALVFLFPSLAEGFGWPIAEAMACGCPVITTNEAPMCEVAGGAGFFISRRPTDESKVKEWTNDAAKIIEEVISLSPKQRNASINASLLNVKRFDEEQALDQIDIIYSNILKGKRQLKFF